MSYKIGTKVRIECNNESKRGVISYINKQYKQQKEQKEEKEEKQGGKEEDKNIIYTYDIIYYDNKEENEVNEGRIYELLQLEYNCEYINLTNNNNNNNNNNNKIDINSISLFKECGNNLFEIKDYSAAYEYYMKVFKYIQDQKLTIGQRVLIKVGNGPTERFEIGMLSDIHNSDSSNNNREKYDVIYDSLVDSSDEEENIDRNRIINIYQDESSENPILALELQRSIFMNLSKTATKRKLKGWAVRWALLAMGLIKGELTKFPEDKRGKYFTDSLFILSKAFLSSSRPQLAKKVAHELSYVERSFSISPKLIRSNNLMKEIDQFILKKQKENKILAKNIAEWVDTAMTINQQQQQNQQKKQQNRDNYNMNEEDDVNIADDLEDIHVEFNNDYDYDDNFRSSKGEAKERNHKNNSKYDEGGDFEEKNSSKRNDSDDSDNNDNNNHNHSSNQKNEDCLIS